MTSNWRSEFGNLWLFDPIDRVAMVYGETGLKLVEETRLTIPGPPISVELAEIFAALD